MKYLESRDDIAQGELIIKGTRIRIVQFLQFLKNGSSLGDIHKMYPWISMKTLSGAVDEAIDTISHSTAHGANFL
jgi:uncharacterized protein (DUF433 family)